MLINAGAHSAGRVLSPESFRLMTQGVVEVGNGRFYGYGIVVRSVDGRTILSHTGGMIGFSGIMLCDLHDGLGVVMLSNGAGKPTLVGEYARQLLHACVAGQRLPAAPASVKIVPNAEDYRGTYSSPNGKRLTIEAQGGQLWLEDGSVRVRLERRGEDAFYVNHPAYKLFLLRFGRRNDLVAEATIGPQWFAGHRFKGVRTFNWPAAWNRFPGHYRSYNPWLANFRIVLRKGSLWFVHPDGSEAVLIPIGPDAFRVGEGGEQLRFQSVIGGLSQRADIGGADYYRVRTP
jgi:hypothetical protein